MSMYGGLAWEDYWWQWRKKAARRAFKLHIDWSSHVGVIGLSLDM